MICKNSVVNYDENSENHKNSGEFQQLMVFLVVKDYNFL